MRREISLLLFILFFAGAAAASGQARITLDVGWENHYRAGRWNPVYVTVSSGAPRTVVLETNVPTDRRYALDIRQAVTISPTPIRVPLYMPLSYSLMDSTVTVKDAESGRRLAYAALADNPFTQQPGPGRNPSVVAGNDLFFGMGGSPTTERMAQSQFQFSNTNVGYLRPEELPAVPIGYDALDLLILNEPDLRLLADDQQRAIVTWVRAGGNLLIWPGADPVPDTSPLVDALPCRMGENQVVEVSPQTLKAAGLPERFGRLAGRLLMPMPDAHRVQVFKGNREIAGYRGRAGFGQIVVLPVDVSLLQFDSRTQQEDFWRRQLEGMIRIPEQNAGGNPSSAWAQGIADVRHQNATARAMNIMGAIPGAGAFGFSYIVAVLVAMMVLVGPVDWFVLKLTNRQPWTWATTAGWAGLITLGAIFIGHLFKSGDLHFRTMSVIDEADGSRVAALDLAAIYSPRTTSYEIACDPESWWRPASDTPPWASGGGLQIDVPCHQDFRGSRLLPLSMNVWNLRYLEGITYATEPAMLDAELALTGRKSDTVSGSISNRSKRTLTHLLIRTCAGVARIDGELAPGQTIGVSGALKRTDQFQMQNFNSPSYYYGRGIPAPQTQPTSSDLARTAELAAERSMRIERLLTADHTLGCIYAQSDEAPATVKLVGEAPLEQHFTVVRSLVQLGHPETREQAHD